MLLFLLLAEQITWVYRPKILPTNGIKWLPLYANARRLTLNNQRYIVDYTGYDERIRKHTSVLTINQLIPADAGTYMCKSNQHQSTANIFNVTVTGKHGDTSPRSTSPFSFSASMKIHPGGEGSIDLSDHQRAINITCTVKELPTNPIDPAKLKWHHKQHEIPHSRHSHLIHSHLHPHQASLVLTIHHSSFNDSGSFKCIYDHGKLSKDVQLIHSSSSGTGERKHRCQTFLFLLSFF